MNINIYIYIYIYIYIFNQFFELIAVYIFSFIRLELEN